MSKLITISGSIRKDSLNEKLAITAAKYAKAKGIDAQYVNLRDYPLPIYNGDLDRPNDKPENVTELKKIFIKSSKIIISSPEHNVSVSPLLKNTIDWISRSDEGELPFAYSAFRSKAVGLLSASPSNFAGIRGLNHLKDILSALFAIIVPEQLCVAKAQEAFDKNGELVNKNHKKILQEIISSVLRVPTVD
ncbi:MAG: NAD(P)H-dependent oxidoreductase [Rickettsiaceae bacterium H1]|nr:NAD(P)H-dependent oxidoreductase [Rickettsiaceae bacterium H1]